MIRITPNLWFDDNAVEAAEFYVSVFPDSRIVETAFYGPDEPGPEGSVVTVSFELDGNPFIGINGGGGSGSRFPFSEAVSFSVPCASQEEVDHYWDALTADGGAPSRCGWLKDRFGVSWQIVPDALVELMASTDTEARNRAVQAMLKMTKLDITELRRAAAGH